MILPSCKNIVGVPSTESAPARSKFLAIGFEQALSLSKISPLNKLSNAVI